MRFGTVYLLASVFLPGTLAGVIDDRQSDYEVPCGDRPLLPGETCCDTPDGKKNICGYGTTCCFFGCCNFGHVCRADGECVPVSDGGPPSDPTTIGGGSPPTSTENGAPPPGTTEGGNPVPTTDENGDPVTTDQGETPPPDTTDQNGNPNPTTNENGDHPTTNEEGNPVPTTDEEGNPIPTTNQGQDPPPATTDQTGIPIPTTNENGNPNPTTDEQGNPVPTTDENGNPVPTTDQDGSPPPNTTDENGNPIPTTDQEGNPVPTSTEGDTPPDTTDENGDPIPTTTEVIPPPNTTDEEGNPVPTTDGGESPPPNTTDEEGNPIPTSTEEGTPPTTTDGDGSPIPTTDENGNPIPTTNEGTDPSPTTTSEGGSPPPTTDEEGSPPPTTEGPGNDPTVTDGPLVTQTEWPPLTIIPVETEVPESDEDDGDPVFPFGKQICIRWDGGPIIGGWRWILPPGIYTSGPPSEIEWPEGVRIEGSLPPWPKITIGNDHKPTYEDEPTSCETKSATIHVTTTSYGVSISGTVTSTTTSRVLETSNVILGCDVEDDEATETQTEVTSTSEAPDVFTDVGEWAGPLPTDDLASTGPEAASMFSEIDAYYSSLDAEELSTTMSTVLSESTSTDFPTLTGEPTTDPTTIPIETSEGSSCVSTITTSVCQIPGQPCSPSLSCESWTATATTSDTPTEPSEPPEPSYSWSATFYRNKCDEDITDYYSVGGYAEQGPDTACVRLKDPDVPEHDDLREYCRFFTDGGDEHGPCSEATFDEVQSWVIRDGFCTVYETEDCTHDGNRAEELEIDELLCYAASRLRGPLLVQVAATIHCLPLRDNPTSPSLQVKMRLLTAVLVNFAFGLAWAGCPYAEHHTSPEPRSDHHGSTNREVSDDKRGIFYLNRIAPSGSLLYVANADGSDAKPLMKNGSAAFDFHASWSPWGEWIVFSSERRADGQSDIYRVKSDGSQLETLVQTDSFEDAGVLSPDGNTLAYVSTQGNYTANIWVKDLKTGIARNLTDTASARGNRSSPQGHFRPSWSPDGEWIAFSSDRNTEWTGHSDGTGWEHTQTLSIYIIRPNGSDFRLVASKPSYALGSPQWSPDGNRILYSLIFTEDTYGAHGVSSQMAALSGQIASVDIATGLDIVEHTSGPYLKVGPHYIGDGGNIGYVVKAGPSEGINYTKPDTSRTAFLGSGIRNPSWSPDGSKVVYEVSSWDVRPGAKKLFSWDDEWEYRFMDVFPQYNKATERLAFTQKQLGNSSVVTSSTKYTDLEDVFDVYDVWSADNETELGNIKSGLGGAFQPTWSPDGSQVAVGFGVWFFNRNGNPASIYLANATGNGFYNLTDTYTDLNAGFPSFSPDGTKLVYRLWDSKAKTPLGLRILDLTTGTTTNLTSGWDNTPGWSPDGERIVFTRQVNWTSEYGSRWYEDRFDIMTIRPDGSDLTQVTDSPANDAHAVWSYDGRILWSTGMYGFRDESCQYENTFQPYGQIMVMDSDGSNKRMLTDSMWEDSMPLYVPRG
ncbi:hypothetical protein NM208_g964 [Fusarium decemcellulare]|uniref:Uncharacterized protein n=1 Tax=Fusarium decemcellulare TaxID=57161 RepID=A0ACC1SXW3_9HYPO|nr:hypothetical protein NM208_g964 [Fusarium decemcellulare]